jgi:GntR family transcriptional repressor for pyruvate dehydrogenase complex
MPSAPVFALSVARPRLSEEIVGILQEQIISGRIPPGTKLPTENELAVSFKVNRTTLREALRRLEHLELIETRQGDGIYVKDYLESCSLDLIKAALTIDKSHETILNLLDVRLAVGPTLAARAAERRTDADLEELLRVIEDRDRSTAERDLKVHRTIARATHNVVYIISFNFLSQIHLLYGTMYYGTPGTGRHTDKFHRDIFDAIRKREPRRARSIMHSALLRADRNFRAILDGKA